MATLEQSKLHKLDLEMNLNILVHESLLDGKVYHICVDNERVRIACYAHDKTGGEEMLNVGRKYEEVYFTSWTEAIRVFKKLHITARPYQALKEVAKAMFIMHAINMKDY